MKRFSLAVVCVAAFAAMSQAQEQPAAVPAAAVQPAPAAVAPPAAPAVDDAKQAADQLRLQAMDVKRQINALEQQARKGNPAISAKLDELEQQRRQVFVQAKPELEALYAQQDTLQEKAKETQRGGAKAKLPADGEGKPGKAEKKAARKAAAKP